MNFNFIINMQKCIDCLEQKDLQYFEKKSKYYRKTCKKCINQKKKEKKYSDIDIDLIEKPEKCIMCNILFDKELFILDFKNQKYKDICLQCYSKTKRYERYRFRKRLENEEEYLKHNAEAHKKWADDNKDKIKEQQYKNKIIPHRKLCQIRQSAKLRNIYFKEEDFEKMESKLNECCYYCGYKHNEYLNGLDRVDNSIGYIDNNTVSCCIDCNMMKCTYNINVFINHIRKIYIFNNDIKKDEEIIVKKLKSMHLKRHDNTYKKSSKNDLLNMVQRKNIMNMKCYICDKDPPNGIDRYDSSLDYTIENSKPCCSICNYIKKDYKYDDFLNHIKNIYEYTKFWILFD